MASEPPQPWPPAKVPPPKPIPGPPKWQLEIMDFLFRIDLEQRGFSQAALLKSRATEPFAAGILAVRYREEKPVDIKGHSTEE
jgi:hypothetical protein